MDNPIFWLFALVAVAAAGGMISTHNAIHSALFLVLNFAAIAALYVLLNAPFIAMVQITVYAGAIMVLFLFVIMLLGAEKLRGVAGSGGWQRNLAIVLAAILIVAFAIVFLDGTVATAVTSSPIDTSPTALGVRLFSGYILPFELTGILLLASMIGVVILNKARGGEKDV
ncbi:MAG: NADH-quinone oxidoreductase subunit J [Ardenticatenaceae bacterium]|nr:NADH-quinone oxidoreductase subunit J [Ardenticatenaceae bacterium]